MPSIKDDTGICCCIPDGICLRIQRQKGATLVFKKIVPSLCLQVRGPGINITATSKQRKRTADVDDDYGEPSRDGNCTDNEILLPDGDAVSRGNSNKTLDQNIYTWTHMRRTIRAEAKTKAR